MHQFSIRAEKAIHALSSTIWRVLTSPGYTRQYFFDCSLLSHWHNGEEVKGYLEGENNVLIYKGRVLESIPGLQLSFTLEEPERPFIQLEIFYFLIPLPSAINLVAEIRSNSRDALKTFGNWEFMLQQIKWLAEYFPMQQEMTDDHHL